MAKKLSNPDKSDTWEAFAHLVKVTHCLRTTGLPFLGICITCGKQFHISYLDAGHCFAGRTNSKLLIAKFVRAQCQYCNRFLHGKQKKFEKIIRQEYGDAFVDQQLPRLNKVIQDKNIKWKSRTARYNRRFTKVMREHGYKTYGELLQMNR